MQARCAGDTSSPTHQQHGEKHLRWVHCPTPPTQHQQIPNMHCVRRLKIPSQGTRKLLRHMLMNSTKTEAEGEKEKKKFLCFFLWNGSGKSKVTHPRGVTHFPSRLQSLRTDGQYLQRVKTNLASPDPKYGIPPSPIKKVRRKYFAHLRKFLITGKKKLEKHELTAFNKSQLVLVQLCSNRRCTNT